MITTVTSKDRIEDQIEQRELMQGLLSMRLSKPFMGNSVDGRYMVPSNMIFLKNAAVGGISFKWKEMFGID